MWIAWGIVLFLLLLIAVILLLPVYVTIRIDKNDPFYFRYKFLHKTYGENPDPNNKVVRTLKKASGVSRLEKPLKSGVADDMSLIAENITLVIDLLKEVVRLLGHCKAKIFKLRIVCAEADAADTAITYGQYCTTVYPLLGVVYDHLKIRRAGHDVQIVCDYNGGDADFAFETVLVVRVFRIIGALLRVVIAEAKRESEPVTPTNTQTSI